MLTGSMRPIMTASTWTLAAWVVLLMAGSGVVGLLGARPDGCNGTTCEGCVDYNVELEQDEALESVDNPCGDDGLFFPVPLRCASASLQLSTAAGAAVAGPRPRSATEFRGA